MGDQVVKEADSRKDSMAGIDFIISIILIVLSIGVSLWSLKMPRPEGWITAPGLFPLFLSVSTFFMALSLFASSLRNEGLSQLIAKLRGFSINQFTSERVKAKRTLWIIISIAFYIFVLIERIPFELATFIYLAPTLYVFWREGGWLKIILISIAVPLFMCNIFRVFFGTFMPGDYNFDWLYRYLNYLTKLVHL